MISRSIFQQAPEADCEDEIWARLCCEQAMLAAEESCYGVGALLVNEDHDLIAEAHNKVFSEGYQSQRHAEMELIDQLELHFADLPRDSLTLYVSLEPCLMCTGRILLSGIRRVRYLTRDPDGGFACHLHHLPPAWKNLASRLSVAQARVHPFWKKLARQLAEENLVRNREKVLKAWQG